MAVLTVRYQEALARIRSATEGVVASAWDRLESYDADVVNDFIDDVVPIVGAAQAQAAVLTDAYLASAIGRAPIGIELDAVTGAAVRAGTPPEQVYARPFISVWTGLKNGRPWVDAVATGRARATSSATMDVALSTRAAASQIGELDDRIVGYQRVPDGSACDFCTLVAGQRYRTDDLMPLHNHCGCTVEPILASERGRFTGKDANDLDLPITRDGVTAAVREHGELGPLLVNGDQHFTGDAALDL